MATQFDPAAIGRLPVFIDVNRDSASLRIGEVRAVVDSGMQLHIDEIKADDKAAEFRGWVFEKRLNAAPEAVLVFRGDRLMRMVVNFHARIDVADAFGLVSEAVGFSFSLPVRSLTGSLQFYAMSSAGTFMKFPGKVICQANSTPRWDYNAP